MQKAQAKKASKIDTKKGNISQHIRSENQLQNRFNGHNNSEGINPIGIRSNRFSIKGKALRSFPYYMVRDDKEIENFCLDIYPLIKDDLKTFQQPNLSDTTFPVVMSNWIKDCVETVAKSANYDAYWVDAKTYQDSKNHLILSYKYGIEPEGLLSPIGWIMDLPKREKSLMCNAFRFLGSMGGCCLPNEMFWVSEAVMETPEMIQDELDYLNSSYEALENPSEGQKDNYEYEKESLENRLADSLKTEEFIGGRPTQLMRSIEKTKLSYPRFLDLVDTYEKENVLKEMLDLIVMYLEYISDKTLPYYFTYEDGVTGHLEGGADIYTFYTFCHSTDDVIFDKYCEWVDDHANNIDINSFEHRIVISEENKNSLFDVMEDLPDIPYVFHEFIQHMNGIAYDIEKKWTINQTLDPNVL